MSSSSKDTPKKKIVELPDKKAIRKLFPPDVIKEVEKEIEQGRRSRSSSKVEHN